MKKCSVGVLILALVLSLAAPGFAADVSAFSDAGEIQNWAAVAALGKLGVVDGKDDGSFDPRGPVTRGEAAKLVYMMAWGGKDAKSDGRGEGRFSDVAGHWAERYILWCTRENILEGRGDGTFDPDGEVTGVELAKMVLVLLGYDPLAYGLVGNRWETRSDELAMMLGLYDGTPFADADDPLVPASREEAAQILYNGLSVGVIGIVEDGNGGYYYASRSDENGEAVTLLMERFGMGEVTELPVQPRKEG